MSRNCCTRRYFATRMLISGLYLFLPGTGFAASPAIQIRDLYNKDLSFSPLAQSFDNKMVEIWGFMAPPLKAESCFFVLTQRPMAVCPFCDSEADWPDNIVAVYAKRIVKVIGYNIRIAVRGQLHLSSYTDPETGFVSRIRLTNAVYHKGE